MSKIKSKTITSLKRFWRSEITAYEVYSFLRKRVPEDSKGLYEKFSKMEKGHSEVWNNIATREFNRAFKRTIFDNIRIFLLKIFSIIIPLPIMINYLEFEERNAIINYSQFLEQFSTNEVTTNLVEKVITDEIGHEYAMMEQMLNKKSYLHLSRQAIQGFTLAIINIFAILFGLFVIFPSDPLKLLITILITVMSGMVITFASTFISSKSQKEISDSGLKEIDIKVEVHPQALREDFKTILLERGVSENTSLKILDLIGENNSAISDLVKSIKYSQTKITPFKSAFVTSVFYFLGALTSILPLLFLIFISSLPTYAGIIIAAILASIFSIFSGNIIAILSGKKMIVKAMEYFLVVLLSAGISYLIGFLLNLLIL